MTINVSHRTGSTRYNPVIYQRQNLWAWSRLLCQPDNSDLLIYVSNRTHSITATILWIINATTTGCDLVCYVNLTISIYKSKYNCNAQCQPDNCNQFICCIKPKITLNTVIKAEVLYWLNLFLPIRFGLDNRNRWTIHCGSLFLLHT